MAAVRLFSTFMLMLSQVAFAAAPVSSLEASLDAARVMLERGDAAKARVVAKELRLQNASIAALYELEWIATRIKARSRAKFVEKDDSQLAWKASAEIWRDEWESYLSQPKIRQTESELTPNEEELAALRSVLLNPSLIVDGKMRSELEEPLLTLLYNDFVKGDATRVPSRFAHWIRAAAEQGSMHCQWKALSLVEDEKSDFEALQKWNRNCVKCEGKFCSVAALRLADKFTEAGRYQPALEIYQQQARAVKLPSASLQYRVVALQILSGKPIENVLRAASPVLASEEGVVTDAQRASIRSHICEDLSGIEATSLRQLATRVYTARTWVQQLRGWILSCNVDQSRRIAKVASLPKIGEVERDSIRMAFEVRVSQQKSEQIRLKRQMERATSVDGNLSSQPKQLGGVLKIPVLFPFPAVENARSSYSIGDVFSRAVSG